jgi:uncharacterized membrane protein YeiH
MSPLQLLDYACMAVCAATGALAASRRQVDMLGFVFLAIITGVGGGTLRDITLGAAPVFWVRQPEYLVVAAAAAVIVYFSAHLIWPRYLWLLWLDNIALSVYCVFGAAKGLELGAPAPIAVVAGVMTATIGGILRDIVIGQPSALMQREIYITAALAGAGVYTILSVFGAPIVTAALIAFLAAFTVRGGALCYGWKFPTFCSRAGRMPDEPTEPQLEHRAQTGITVPLH